VRAMQVPLAGERRSFEYSAEENAGLIPPVRSWPLFVLALGLLALGVQGILVFKSYLDSLDSGVVPDDYAEPLAIADLVVGIFALLGCFFAVGFGVQRLWKDVPERRGVRQGVLAGSVPCFRMDVGPEDWAAFATSYYGPGGAWRRTALASPVLLELILFGACFVMLNLKKLGKGTEVFGGDVGETELFFALVSGAAAIVLVPLGRAVVYGYAVCQYRRRHGKRAVVLLVASDWPLFLQDRSCFRPPSGERPAGRRPVVQLFRRQEAWSLVVSYALNGKQKNAGATTEYPVQQAQALALHTWLSEPQRLSLFQYVGASATKKIGAGAQALGKGILAPQRRGQFDDYVWAEA